MRLLVIALLAVSASASAQGTKAPATNTQAKQATKGTPPATKQPSPATKQDAKAPGTKTAAPAAQGRPGVAVTPETPPPPRIPPVLREDYDYDAGGRRDPFFSLMGSAELRPTVADLKLTSVLYHPTRPIAMMRDMATNTRYTVTLGTTLGRMRVVMIRPRVVIFSIEEFGLNRQDSVVLADTSKARAR